MHSFFPGSPRTTGPRNWRWLLSSWLPAIAGIAIICVESTGTFSAQNTSSWLRPIFERMFGAFHDATWDSFHHSLRKTGHFLGYGALGLAFLRAWLSTLRGDVQLGRSMQSSLLAWRLRATALAILSTAFIASCDEFHQAFLAGRTGLPSDVLLDTCGACALCLLVWLVRFRGAVPVGGSLPADV
jgi:VanZ family protein